MLKATQRSVSPGHSWWDEWQFFLQEAHLFRVCAVCRATSQTLCIYFQFLLFVVLVIESRVSALSDIPSPLNFLFWHRVLLNYSGVELWILLPQPPWCWDHSCNPTVSILFPSPEPKASTLSYIPAVFTFCFETQSCQPAQTSLQPWLSCLSLLCSWDYRRTLPQPAEKYLLIHSLQMFQNTLTQIKELALNNSAVLEQG